MISRQNKHEQMRHTQVMLKIQAASNAHRIGRSSSVAQPPTKKFIKMMGLMAAWKKKVKLKLQKKDIFSTASIPVKFRSKCAPK